MQQMPADYTPQRVVCLQPSATVILAAIGGLDRVVACTKYCADVCPEVKRGGRSNHRRFVDGAEPADPGRPA